MPSCSTDGQLVKMLLSSRLSNRILSFIPSHTLLNPNILLEMSRAAKATLMGSILISGLTVWGVHYMQVQERETMQRGVDRDTARLAEKASKRQKEAEQHKRAQDHELNKVREEAWQKLQPSAGYIRKGER